MSNYRVLSKGNWKPKNKNGIPSDQEIQTGCMQRIADATEIMATNFLKLQSENEYLRNRNQSLKKELESTKRSAYSYKGKFNRLRNHSWPKK